MIRHYTKPAITEISMEAGTQLMAASRTDHDHGRPNPPRPPHEHWHPWRPLWNEDEGTEEE